MRRSRAANDQIDRAERIATYLGGLSPEAAAAFTAIGEDAAALSAGLSAAAGAAHQAVVESGVAQRVWLSACDRVELTTAAAGEAISRLRLVLRRVEGEGNRAVIRHLRSFLATGRRRGQGTLAELRAVLPLVDELAVQGGHLGAVREEIAGVEARLENDDRERRLAEDARHAASLRREALVDAVVVRTQEALLVWTLAWRQQEGAVLAAPEVELPVVRRPLGKRRRVEPEVVPVEGGDRCTADLSVRCAVGAAAIPPREPDEDGGA